MEHQQCERRARREATVYTLTSYVWTLVTLKTKELTVATAVAVPGLDANNSYSSISNTSSIVMCQQILPLCKVASAETVSSAPSCYKLHD
jgi:hypothetical protein